MCNSSTSRLIFKDIVDEQMDGWMNCDFMSKVFQSYQDDLQVIMESCMCAMELCNQSGRFQPQAGLKTGSKI